MSIQKLVSNAIEKFRFRTKVLAVLDNPSAPLAERAKAIKAVLAGNPDLWLEIAKRTAPKPKEVVVAAIEQIAPTTISVQPALVPAPKPGTILSALPAPAPAPMPGKSLPLDRPERRMRGEAPKPTISDFADKLNGAAKELGLEDRSVLGRFRKVLNDLSGKGLDYWNLCREVVEDALRGADLTGSDWDLSVEKMKHNLFFTGRRAALFIDRCPKEKLTHLLLDQDGLTGLVAQIRTEEYENKSSVYRIAFILDACVKVGHEAKVLRINCAHAVNRMKQRGFISAEHWLVRKVADMKRPQLPEKLFAPPESIAVPAGEPLPVEETVDEPAEPTNEEPERLTPLDKPVEVDINAAYEQQMLAAAGESTTVQ